MNDPPRLRDQSNNPLISEMLSAAERQEPGRRAVHSTLLAAAAAASVVGGQATAGAAVVGTTGLALTKLAVKWTLLSALAVGGGVAGIESSGVLRDEGVTGRSGAAHGDSRTRQPAPARARAPSKVDNVAAFPEVVAPEPAPPALALPVTAQMGQKPLQPIPIRPEQLEREVALLDEARSALGQERYADVRRISERYLRDYPSGRLEQEARYLRMQAAHSEGDRARAEAEARALLELNPNGPHAKAAREVYAENE